MTRHYKRLILPAAVCALCGCAQVDTKQDFDRAAREVSTAVGDYAIYRPEEEAAIQDVVQALRRDGLTVHEATQICLLNNPGLQAELLKIGIARADFIQSGLLSNPGFSFAPRWPDGAGLANLQLGIAMSVAELWQIPFRQEAAERSLDQTILEVARRASLMAQDARLAYYRVLQSEQVGLIAEENAALTGRLVDLAIGRRDAGAGSDVDVHLARAQHADAKLRSGKAALAVVEARADLVRLLGLGPPDDDIRLTEALPRPMASVFTPEQLVAVGRERRLDWRAARMAIDAASARIDYERSRVLRVLEVGVSAERNAQWDKSRGNDGLAPQGNIEVTANGFVPSANLVPQTREPERSEWVVGPSLNLDLPIFDQNQAQIARARFMHRQAVKLADALERDVARDARVGAARLQTAAEQARLYAEEIVPLRERALSLAEDGYRAGRTSFLAVVQSQQALAEARAGYVDALRDHAAAIVEIERVAGCPLERIVQSTAIEGEVGGSARSEAPVPTSMPVEVTR